MHETAAGVPADERVPPPDAPRPRRPRSRRRWLRRALLVTLVCAIGGYAALVLVMERRLAAAIAEKYGVRCRMTFALYLPPHTVWARGAVVDRADGLHMEVPWARLVFTEPPLSDDAPLDELTLHRPTVDLREPESPAPPPEPQDAPSADDASDDGDADDATDQSRPRRIEIRRGRIRHVDGSDGTAAPLVWRDIDATLDAGGADDGGGDPTAYAFTLSADAGEAGRIDARGTADVADLVFEFTDATLALHLDPDADRSPVAGRLQQALRDRRVRGNVLLTGTGRIDLNDPARSAFDAEMLVSDASLDVPEWETRVSSGGARVAATSEGDGEPIVARLSGAKARAGAARVSVAAADLAIDLDQGRWAVEDLRARLEARHDDGRPPLALGPVTLAGAIDLAGRAHGPFRVVAPQAWHEAIVHDLTLRPDRVTLRVPRRDVTLADIAGDPIRITAGTAEIAELSVRYGPDEWELTRARVSLTDLPRGIRADEIGGWIRFNQVDLPYPGKISKTIAFLRPTGAYHVGGWCAFDFTIPRDKGPASYELTVASDTGALAPRPLKAPIAPVVGHAVFTPRQVILYPTEGTTLGGRLSAEGRFDKASFWSYGLVLALRDADLAHLAPYLPVSPEQERRLTGRGLADVQLAGTLVPGLAMNSLEGGGRVHVVDGDFWQVPVLSHMLDATSAGRQAVTAGEAAAVFTVNDGVVHLSRAAVSAPVLGLQGGGRVGLDGSLQLDVVAAPLADWRRGLRETGIPVVSDVAGEIAGAVQRLLNTATRGLIYEFRITGTVRDVVVTAVPTPVLTDAAALLFGEMLKERKDRPLVDALGEDAEQRRSPP